VFPTVNLRGLGAERSLILVDGRRLKSPSTGNSQDLNSIPIAAVEKEIEILSVAPQQPTVLTLLPVYYLKRKDFDGVELRLGASDAGTPREGGDREEGSAVFGTNQRPNREHNRRCIVEQA
jgi:iron complex outermembrane receptor protein